MKRTFNTREKYTFHPLSRKLTKLRFLQYSTYIIEDCVSVANIDNDTNPEVIIGNQRGGFRFYKSNISGKISLTTNDDLLTKSFEAKIYPNPTKNYLIIETDLVNENAQISLINILGSTILNQTMTKSNNETKLELSNIQLGIYFVKIQTETGKQLFQRVVIE
jgi:hypothetical protein